MMTVIKIMINYNKYCDKTVFKLALDGYLRERFLGDLVNFLMKTYCKLQVKGQLFIFLF